MCVSIVGIKFLAIGIGRVCVFDVVAQMCVFLVDGKVVEKGLRKCGRLYYFL